MIKIKIQEYSSCRKKNSETAKARPIERNLRPIEMLHKEDLWICLARLIERELWLIETWILHILNQTQKPAKRLGFEFNTAWYQRETLIHVFQVLWVTPMRFMRFCNLLTQQAFTKKKIQAQVLVEINCCNKINYYR